MKFFENIKGVSIGSKSIPFERRQEHLDNIAKLDISVRQPLILGYDSKDPHGKAKDAAVRFFKFVKLLSEDIHPSDTIFGLHLFALNEYNSNELVSLSETHKEAIIAAKNYFDTVQNQRPKTIVTRPSSPIKKEANWQNGILLNKRLVMFAQILIREHDLTPFDLIYSIELLLLNIKNIPDFPLSHEDQKKAEEAANAYYEQSL